MMKIYYYLDVFEVGYQIKKQYYGYQIFIFFLTLIVHTFNIQKISLLTTFSSKNYHIKLINNYCFIKTFLSFLLINFQMSQNINTTYQEILIVNIKSQLIQNQYYTMNIIQQCKQKYQDHYQIILMKQMNKMLQNIQLNEFMEIDDQKQIIHYAMVIVDKFLFYSSIQYNLKIKDRVEIIIESFYQIQYSVLFQEVRTIQNEVQLVMIVRKMFMK
ncbi:unnamed protein product [Paramecium sonneborni]|uniref:Transmembrane protein n=1 Tax=Paramecium sonneborni TaxID=65129 RepID=A0A8S1NH43_9CILI|nr:unnamed protein product [Paramecium sonneborni]